MGEAIGMGTGCAVQDSVVTTFGDCGSNVTPLLMSSGNYSLVRNNHFNNGCTIYSIRSQVSLLWESTVSHYYGHGGRGGNGECQLQCIGSCTTNLSHAKHWLYEHSNRDLRQPFQAGIHHLP
jgi:hypothetical protein